MKNRFVRILSLILVLVLCAGFVRTIAFATPEDTVVIKLHYHRPDGDYTDWSVWFWNLGQEGVDVPFVEENGEMVATFQVAPGATSVGYIVKLPGWAAKDVNEDQFIDVAAYTSGTIHAYVESGVKGCEIVLGDDVSSGIKLISASYDERKGFVIVMNTSIGDGKDAFTITGPEGKLNIVAVNQDGGKYTLVYPSKVDLFADYTLTYDGETYEIAMPNVYSTDTFEQMYTYAGTDLGATWSKEKTLFRVWAPTAQQVLVNLYESGTDGTDDLLEQLTMTADANGTWVAEKSGDLNGVYYTYQVTVDGVAAEACDPYARTTGVNGKRAMVIDLDSTDPEGWENDTDPHAGNAITDAVIYELHVRDLSIDPSSGIQNKGKYLGLIETGTTNPNGVPTGIDHIKDLGITHLHLLPVYDYGSVDESRLDTPQFNWGYDPVNYNVPEGSYATDPYSGEVRVKEFKQMVQGLHANGISVVMDVVYNHVYSGGDFCFNKIVPGYFSRISDTGVYSNGSGCGNDTASERAMVRKYIVESVLYWVEEYHIDGFRFDLVGLLDTETINQIIETVHEKHPNVIFYGEGWTMTTNTTKSGVLMTTQVNSEHTPGFSFFSDTIRDALKGSVFNDMEKGYVSGADGKASTIAKSFMGMPSWASSPAQCVNYASCHDNLSLFDKLAISNKDDTVEDRIRMNNLAAAIYMTSQGVPFLQAGEEMLRSKPLEDGSFDHNSYASPDSVNSFKWDDLNDASYADVFHYYKGLIAFRKAHPALRMSTTEEVTRYITPVEGMGNGNAFHIAAGAGGEAHDLFVIFNPKGEEITVTLPEGKWTVYIDGEDAGLEALYILQGEAKVAPISAMVLVNDGAKAPAQKDGNSAGKSKLPVILGAAGAGVVALGAAATVILKKKKKK